MSPDSLVPEPFHACQTDAFRVESGVNRGEGLDAIDMLNLGDIYRLKDRTKWLPVFAQDDTRTRFVLELAANMPRQVFTSLAHLIFMTTTGRRADAFLGACDGRALLICDRKLDIAAEYVLIHIEARDIEVTPTRVAAPDIPARTTAATARNVVPLRVTG